MGQTATDHAFRIEPAKEIEFFGPLRSNQTKATMRRRIKGDKVKVVTPPKLFETAAHQNGLPPVPRMKKGFEAIATSLFDKGYDVAKEFESIQSDLTIKDALSPTHVQNAANKAEDVARRAMRLYVVAKVEFATYNRRTDSIVGAMRSNAIDALEAMKAKGALTKQITNDDVAAEAAKMYPDEWEDVHNRRDRSKEMLRFIERLADLGKSRTYTVSNMLAGDSRRV